MAQAQLTADTNQQVQRNCQGNIGTDGNQITLPGAGKHTGAAHKEHDNECNGDQQVDSGAL